MAKHREAYPQSRSFEMAPNAGVSEGRAIDRVSKSHGASMNLSGKQHIVETAHVREWGEMPYAEMQHADGSMNYMEHKMKIASSDAAKLRKPQRGVDNAS